MTQTELRELIPSWQLRLRIQDWRIKLKFVDFDNSYGNCDCNLEDKTASIKILNLKDKLWGSDSEVTPERVLVHEMLHILLWELVGDTETGSEKSIKEEQVVNFLTDALVP